MGDEMQDLIHPGSYFEYLGSKVLPFNELPIIRNLSDR
jgi:hypothetical protein